MISMGGIIGAGLFVGSSAAIAVIGPAVIVSYLLAGVVIVLIMRMLAEMAVGRPEVRSFTEFARAGLGDWAGFLAGWLYWYFWVVVIPVEAIAGANLLHGLLAVWIDLPVWFVGFALMSLMAGINLLSARAFGEFEFWFASIKVVAIVVFIAFAATYASGWLPHSGSTYGNLVRWGGFAPHGMVAILAGVATVFFAITGAEITAVAAAESAQPAEAVARLSSAVIVRILLFYVVSVLLIVAVVPWSQVKVGQSPFTQVLLTIGLPWAGRAMDLIILTAVLSCLNSAFYVCSRVLFVLAEHGDAPQSLVKLSARRVPARSVMIGAVAGMIGIIANARAPSTVFAFLLNASGALIVFVYLLICLAQIRLRRQFERTGSPPAGLRMWWFPWSSYAAIAGMLAVLVAMARTPALASQLYVSVLALAFGSVACIAVQRRKRQWRH
ncbi:MAG TPA: amino acid permease [Steroidobacteraceae bacterium]|nr:amino acid permease [Steroidobacteraceae bacterium]